MAFAPAPAARLLHYSDLETACDDPECLGRLVGTIAAHRTEDTVVAGTGDTLAPSVLSLETDGRHALELFEAVQPDVETLGNHDFDRGAEALRSVVHDSPQTWVNANVFAPGSDEPEPRDRSDGEVTRVATHPDDEPFPGTTPTTVLELERADLRVGFVGVSDPASSIPPSVPVADPVDAVREAATDCPDVDRFVVLAHLRDDSARAVATLENVDVVLAGHVHRETCEYVDDTLFVRPGATGRVVWDVDLETLEARQLDVTDGPIDRPVMDRFETLREETGLAEVVAQVDEPLPRERERCFDGECRLGPLVADAYRWATDADVGYVDTRSLREGPPLSGDVTVADLVGVVPFDAPLFVLEVSGAVLRELLEDTIVAGERYDGRDRDLLWGQVSGVRGVWDERERTVGDVLIRGEPLETDANYELATSGYVVASDEFPAVDRSFATRAWGVQYEALVEYVRRVGLEVEPDCRLELPRSVSEFD
ncbi:bifunctional metallophosphatase/5'-nucleotidase [Natronoglomus mannanivorans]|uniref:Bifunctional metallophosphatase/5'-nucleotidase n=1 Tax=Natronoglomus mannanivorans TaxID=2979990 RepID=A0AAP2YWA3_9EURY|nr:bifunctional metallophosphatase/5'-nucleotidase [Halobacteria archaeon AArc-xg1-1]